MSWSFVEIKSLAVKAARGFGMPWGLAEEAGFATVWLEKQGAPGVEALANYLNEAGDFSAGTCPIFVGCRVSDSGSADHAFPTGLYQPLLCVPFLSAICSDDAMGLKWGDGVVSLNKTGISGSLPNGVCTLGVHLCTTSPADIQASDAPAQTRVPGNRASFVNVLGEFAHKTYAPATEESRAKGAGAGTTDND